MSTRLRVLGERDLASLNGLLATDPDTHCLVAARVRGGGLHPARLGGQIWGWFQHGQLLSALYLGANLVPVSATEAACRGFATQLARQPRRGSSIVGTAAEVLDLWERVEHAWGPAREVRRQQPLLALDSTAGVVPDERVRLVRPEETDTILPSCIAMFTEEVGVSPVAGGTESAYRARIAEMVRARRCYARIEAGQVLFKAEIGAVSEAACQIQGVWVSPRRRGAGLAAPGLAAVAADALKRVAPRVTLYANLHNEPALRTYARVGFAPVGMFATVLF